MEHLKHVWPSMEYKEDSINYIKEFYECNSEIHGVSGLNRYLEDYEGWLEHLEYCRSIEPNEQLVPSESYLLVREEDNKVVGMINLRVMLNEGLKKFGGHIGYSVRPSERKKGYNKVNLYLILKRCCEIGLEEVLLDCSINNPGSYRSMESLGGVRIDKYYNEQYGWCYRYSINVLESVNKYREVYEPLVSKCLVKKGE